jgi:hypothetical protein
VLYAVTRFPPRLVAEAWSPGLAAPFSGSLVLFILISYTKFRPHPRLILFYHTKNSDSTQKQSYFNFCIG